MGFIGVDPNAIAQLSALAKQLKDAPPEIIDAAIDGACEYVINVFQIYPSKQRITRKAAYGSTFVSAKQRAFFFWALKNGRINVPYRRTQALRRGWKQIGRGRNSIIANETPYSPFVMGAGEQSRMMTLIGWKDTESIIKERGDQIERKAQAAADKVAEKLNR